MTERASEMSKTAGAANAEPPFWAETVYEWVFAHLPKSRGGRIAMAVCSFCIIGAIVLSLILVPLLGDDVDEGRLEAFGYLVSSSRALPERRSSSFRSRAYPLWLKD